MKTTNFKDDGYFRRQFPRREYTRNVGVLCGGTYIVTIGGELGEGGMSILTDYVLDIGNCLIVSFQIPGGDFVSLRAQVKSHIKKGQQILHGLSFTNIEFALKRQIRAFVSKRADIESSGQYRPEH